MQKKAKQLSKIFLTCMEVSVLRGFLRLLSDATDSQKMEVQFPSSVKNFLFFINI